MRDEYWNREAYDQRFPVHPLRTHSHNAVAHHPLTFNHFGPWGEQRS